MANRYYNRHFFQQGFTDYRHINSQRANNQRGAWIGRFNSFTQNDFVLANRQHRSSHRMPDGTIMPGSMWEAHINPLFK